MILEKAREVNPQNPDGLRAIGEHVGVLLEHLVVLAYIERLFAPQEAAPPPDEAP